MEKNGRRILSALSDPSLRSLKLVVAIISAMAIVCAYLVHQYLVMPSYIELEREQALKDLFRVKNCVNHDLSVLSNLVNEYSAWDDTYEFVQTRSQGFINANLDLTYFSKSHDLCAVEIHDARCRPVWIGVIPEHEGTNAPGLREILGSRALDSLLLKALESEDGVAGLVSHQNNIYLVAVRMITRSSGASRPDGTLAMARKLTGGYLEKLTKSIAMDFTVSKDAGASVVASPNLEVLNKNILLASQIVPDIQGNTPLRIETRIPRDILKQGKKTATIITVGILTIGALLIALSTLSLTYSNTLNNRMKELQIAVKGKDSEIAEREKVEARLNTSLKTLAEEIEKSEAQKALLNASEARNKAILEAIPDLIFLIASDGTFIDFSTNDLSKLFMPQGAFIGENISDVMPEELLEDIHEKISEVLRTGNIQTLNYQLKQDDGSIRYFEARMSRTVNGEVLTICSDITDKKEFDLKQQQYKEAMLHQQKIESLGTLASGVAHEFNNVLQILSGKVELLRYKSEENQYINNTLIDMDKHLTRGANIVRSLLAFSHKNSKPREKVDINSEIAAAHEILLATLPKNITINFHQSDDVCHVNIDPGQITQILLNLASNASAAMPHGGDIFIDSKAIVADKEFRKKFPDASHLRYAELRFSDTGSGMDTETRRRIFEPFFTTKEIGKGTGLGLSIIYGIVKDCEGYLDCESEPGKGTDFHIWLPLDLNCHQEGYEAIQTSMKNTGGGNCVLLIDDEETITQALKDYLTGLGHEVLCAFCGEEGLEIYRTNQKNIELVVLDLGMPGMGGRECLSRLRALNPDVPVIVATGYDPESVSSFAEKPDSVISKPYSLKAVAISIENLLAGQGCHSDPGRPNRLLTTA